MRTFVIVLLAVCTESASAQLHVDTTLYAILPFDDHAKMAMNWQFPNGHPDSITQTEVDSLEGFIDSAYRAYIDANRFPHLLEPLAAYRRQYVAFIDENGDREIWINFFCGSFGVDWKHYAMVVDDGGGCFFQVRFNRTKGKLMELLPNGVAFNHLINNNGYRWNLSHHE